MRVGVDVGGTFTDIVVFNPSTGAVLVHKESTTPRRPVVGIMRGLERVGVDLSNVEVFVHATTIGTNMFLGQVGLEPPKAALFTNKGFRDVIEIGRQNRPSLYDPYFEKPKPLIPRRWRIGVAGRIGPGGEELEPLDVERVREEAERLCGEGVRVFVVSFLHSYRNPAHEVEAGRVVAEACPGSIVVLSHKVDPQPMEYERTSTAVVNALLKPMLGEYIGELKRELESRGFRGALLIMQSSGGVAGPEEALERPAAFIESGPSAGAVAVAYFSRLLGIGKALGFDMGGTTAKASSIIGGEPEVVDLYEVGGKVHMGRLIRGSGYPVRFPHIDLAEVSAGGGTIAWIDPGGGLRVGPISAGADPGPACYGRGGEDPTVTDANLVLGRLPETIAGGTMKLDRSLAEKAIREKIADPLGMSVEEAAWAIIKLANTVMGRALRLVSIERGHDPREFSMFAFGGAGPLHAVELAGEVGVPEVVVPPMPGVFSALGLITADYRHDLHEAVVERVDRLDEEKLEAIFERLEEEAHRLLDREGVPRDRRVMKRLVDAKYWGQAYTLRVPWNGSLERLVEDFHRAHEARYGFSSPEEPVEIVVARVEAWGIVDKPRLHAPRPAGERVEPVSARSVYFNGSWLETPVYDYNRLPEGAQIEGPAIVEYPDSTLVLPPGSKAVVGGLGEVRIQVGGGR